MPQLNDCYVLASERSSALAAQFLDRFVPRREPSFVPDDPSEVLGCSASGDVEHVLQHLEAESEQVYSLYFRNQDDCDPLHAALFFNGDGSLILMLSVAASGGAAEADKWLRELQEFSGARLAYWGHEEPPVSGAREFEERVERTPR